MDSRIDNAGASLPKRGEFLAARTGAAALGSLAVWWVAALGSRDGHPWAGVAAAAAFAAAHLAGSSRRGAELGVLFVAAAVGYAGDSALTLAGVLSFPPQARLMGPSPLWMVGLWIVFGALLHGEMRWLHSRLRLAAALGALGGPAAYAGGAAVGALQLSGGRGRALAAVGALYALAVPLLAIVSETSEGRASEDGHERLARRLVTIPLAIALFLAVTALMPIAAPAAAAIDLVRVALWSAPVSALRLLAFGWIYLATELAAVAALFTAWLCSIPTGGSRIVHWTYHIQRLWVSSHLWWIRKIYGLGIELEVEGADAAARGPMLIFIRHSSMVDTLVPTLLFSNRHGIRLRYVLKRELLLDPCMDIAGHRLPARFTARGSSRNEEEIDRVGALGRGLATDEAVIIWPEGTRYSPEKRDRLIARLEQKDPALAAEARALKHLLLPHVGGPLALLETAAEADVVFYAHAGLEGAAGVLDFLSGKLVGRVLRVRLRRVPRAQIPDGREARIRWLFDQWRRMDCWIDEQIRRGGGR
ncbi:MAG: DUF2878 family protein [Candidatus Wallbacteria bacterium]|nr:DUF2878 family protein [Candidatus Wallbacteria bacterium]